MEEERASHSAFSELVRLRAPLDILEPVREGSSPRERPETEAREGQRGGGGAHLRPKWLQLLAQATLSAQAWARVRAPTCVASASSARGSAPPRVGRDDEQSVLLPAGYSHKAGAPKQRGPFPCVAASEMCTSPTLDVTATLAPGAVGLRRGAGTRNRQKRLMSPATLGRFSPAQMNARAIECP